MSKHLKSDIVVFLSIFSLLFISGYLIGQYKLFDIQDSSKASDYILKLTIGCISFSIAFVWSIYGRILDSYSSDNIKNPNHSLLIEKINRLLSKYELASYSNDYKYFIRLPYLVFVLIGLVILPLTYLNFDLHIIYGVNFCIIFMMYVFYLPEIYNWIKGRCENQIIGLLESKGIESTDKKELYSIVLQHNDKEIEELLGSDPDRILNLLMEEVEEKAYNLDGIKFSCVLLELLHQNIEKRTLFYFVFSSDESIFSRLLKLHSFLWKKDIEESEHYLDCFGLNQSVQKMYEWILTESLNTPSRQYGLLMQFKQHIKNTHNDKVNGKKYIECFQSSFWSIFDSSGNSSQAHNVWSSVFPSEWKITIQNIKSEECDVPLFIFDCFKIWLISEFEKIDESVSQLDRINKKLFPDVDPYIWAYLLTYKFRPSYESSVKDLTSQPPGFGNVGRPIMGGGSIEETRKLMEESRKQGEAKAIELSVRLLFGNDSYALSEVNGVLNELEEMKHEKSENEILLGRIDYLHGLFEKIKKEIEKNQ